MSIRMSRRQALAGMAALHFGTGTVLGAASAFGRTSSMKSSHIQTNGITIHVEELGSGPPVLFCHGFPDTWRGWRRQVEAVAAAGYRAISLDMRGYGESSAPIAAELYTTLHSVGDLVGLLDALELRSCTLVGHDFGAGIVWNAALMRPDRFNAVFGMSVAFTPRGDKSILQQFVEAGHPDLYVFDRIRPEADAEWADAATTIPANLYWSSAAAPKEERWTLFNRGLPKYRTLPELLPAWSDQNDIRAEVAEFARTGFHGALNYYRAMQLSFDLLAPLKGKLVEQPSYFLGGAEDGLVKMGGSKAPEELRKVLPGLIGSLIIPDVGHWPQLEASAQTNEALIGFLRQVH
jgi:pimeloyl-ACP methyl ester carboxylesterase